MAIARPLSTLLKMDEAGVLLHQTAEVLTPTKVVLSPASMRLSMGLSTRRMAQRQRRNQLSRAIEEPFKNRLIFRTI